MSKNKVHKTVIEITTVDGIISQNFEYDSKSGLDFATQLQEKLASIIELGVWNILENQINITPPHKIQSIQVFIQPVTNVKSITIKI